MRTLQDFLTSSYLITSKDTFYTREQFGQLMAYMGDGLDAVTLPPPAIVAPQVGCQCAEHPQTPAMAAMLAMAVASTCAILLQELWTGKQLFSLLVRPNAPVTSGS